MSIAFTLRLCAICYLLLAVADGFRKRSLRVFLFDAIPLLCLVALWVGIVTVQTGVVSFGGGNSSTTVILIMFGCILLGIAGRYLFFLKGSFSWIDFLKPLVISPIVLLPLYGSVSGTDTLSSMQTVSFALLAYQNGFFWQAVLDRSKPKDDNTNQEIESERK